MMLMKVSRGFSARLCQSTVSRGLFPERRGRRTCRRPCCGQDAFPRAAEEGGLRLSTPSLPHAQKLNERDVLCASSMRSKCQFPRVFYRR